MVYVDLKGFENHILVQHNMIRTQKPSQQLKLAASVNFSIIEYTEWVKFF